MALRKFHWQEEDNIIFLDDLKFYYFNGRNECG